MKNRIIMILLIVSCLPLVLSSFYYYNLIYNQTIQGYNEKNMEILSAVRNDVSHYLDMHFVVLKVLAQNPSIISLDPNGKSYLVDARKLYPKLELVVDDKVGNQRFRDDNQKLGNAAHRQFFQDSINGKEVVSDVIISMSDGKPIVVLAVPLKNQETITGVIQGALPLSVLDDFLRERAGRQSLAFIVDHSGKILAHTDSNIAAEHKDVSQESYIQDGFTGKSGTTTITDDQGNIKFVYYTYDAKTGWIICSEVSKDVVMAPVKIVQQRFVIVLTLLILIIGTLGYFLSNKFVRPIKIVCNHAREIANGNLAVDKVDITTRDEMGDLASSFNEMVKDLRKLVSNISQSAEQLAASSEELTAGAEQSSQVTSQIAIAITEVAQGTENQVNAVRDATVVIERMSEGIQQVASNASAASGISEKTSVAAEDGSKSIATAISQMANIERAVTNSANVVVQLGNRSKEIGQIVDVISGIAGQTNLLALNAAIEAARAGELGRGFAVVAEEVRKLAEQSQEATKQIANLIGEIQNDTDKAVATMNEGTQEVKIGTEVVSATGESFNNIMKLVNDVSSQVKEISAAIQQLASGSEQVVASVEIIHKISKETAGQTHTVSASTEEQSASMEEIGSSSQSLAKMAQDLQSAIQRFRI
jgi:methyl-accepting chemotaxis protein